MKIFHHNDNDGLCAGFWALNSAFHYDNNDKELYEMNYGMPFPFDEIKKGEQVYIVDYSILPEEMDKLLSITQDVTWIDHHISSIKKYENYNKHIRGIRLDGVAGCMLTYCYLNHMTDLGRGEIKPFNNLMTECAPMFTKYIADYDVWTFKYREKTKKFQIAFTTLYDRKPDAAIWFDLLDDWEGALIVDNIIKSAENMIAYRDNFAKSYCKNHGYEIKFTGLKCFCINIGSVGSEYFNSIDEDKYDMFIAFSYNGEQWVYSLRSTKVNVAEVAMLYGGGGHSGAAGFESKEFLLGKKS